MIKCACIVLLLTNMVSSLSLYVISGCTRLDLKQTKPHGHHFCSAKAKGVVFKKCLKLTFTVKFPMLVRQVKCYPPREWGSLFYGDPCTLSCKLLRLSAHLPHQ